MKNLQQTARVGLFFLLGLALVWVTFETLNGGKGLSGGKTYTVLAGFDTLKELKKGDEVRMAGVKIGEVSKTQLKGRRAEAVLSIDEEFKIKEDATATIVMAGLLGGNYLGVDLGSPNAADLRDGSEIKTATTPDLNSVMTQLGSLGEKLESTLGGIGTALNGDGTKPGLVQNINRLVTDNHDNVTSAVANLKDVTEKINKGEGTLGKLINSPQLHDELLATIGDIKTSAAEAKTFIANAQSIIDQVKAGKGAIGALVFDQTAGDDLKASIANLRATTDKIARGEGTLGKLINDDSVLRDTQAIMKKADRALDGLDDTGPITAVGVIAKGLF